MPVLPSSDAPKRHVGLARGKAFFPVCAVCSQVCSLARSLARSYDSCEGRCVTEPDLFLRFSMWLVHLHLHLSPPQTSLAVAAPMPQAPSLPALAARLALPGF